MPTAKAPAEAEGGGVSLDKEEYSRRVFQIHGQLYKTALLYMGNESQAQDALSEAIYRGLISVRKLREVQYFDTWITRILINECKKIHRRTRREQLVDTLPETAKEAFDALPLKEAIYKLPPEFKEIIILRYFAGMTLAQSADSLGIPLGTAATRSRRALQLLKLELAEEEEVAL